MSSEIKIDTASLKKRFDKTKKFFSNQKIQTSIAIVLLIIIIFIGLNIRLENLPLLKDQTTGEYMPLALDPFYFLRISQTLAETGSLSRIDPMRQPVPQVGFSNEVLPRIVFAGYKIFGSSTTSLEYINIISPVFFFVLGLIAFFFLILFLTKSKTTAVISTALLAVIPSFLYRTVAGFSDHESIGIFAFFLALLIFSLAIKKVGNIKGKSELLKSGLLGGAVAFLSAFTISSWGGVVRFLFMIIPASFFLFWIFETREEENRNKRLRQYLLFYVAWFILTPIFGLIYGFTLLNVMNLFALNFSGFPNMFVLLFIFVDYLLLNKGEKLFKKKIKKRILASFITTIVIGLIVLLIIGANPVSLVDSSIERLTNPFGVGRVEETVSENQPTSFSNWIGQTGKLFFWMFYIGLIFVGFILAKGIEKKRYKFMMALLWVIMVSGILFSDISSTSILNGQNFISLFLYFGSVLLFIIGFVYIFTKDRLNISKEAAIIGIWTIIMLIASKGAVRLFFVVTPLATFIAGYAFTNSIEHLKKSKDDIMKIISSLVIIFIIIAVILSFTSFTKSASAQAKVMGPSAGFQWQSAMKWVRENTQEGSIFAHWWDYGYWVQTLGGRPTIADGGHFEGAFRDHLIGRYLLTTPKPESALSFLKSNNVSYLLIDPTDIGKYGAYSRIGSDDTGEDRFSFIPTLQADPTQTRETRNTTVRIYNAGFLIDQDIIYTSNGTQILLARNNAALLAIIVETTQQDGSTNFQQPRAVFLRGQQQVIMPIRYLYFRGQFLDFGGGLDSAVRLTPAVTNQGTSVDSYGALVYLSPRTFNSLVGQLYLLDDPLNNYEGLELAYKEQDPAASFIRQQVNFQDDFLMFNGLRGPIKIWKVDAKDNILVKEEFLRVSGEYAEFDNLSFRK